ncbi:MAG: alanine--tRNA ligase [Lachnospiraceae bacterium]|nr:alanine--tRNA ligase [Lachnospiraceae bacterium]
MDTINLKKKYIDFFVSKNHKQIESASVVPVDDPTCLFNTAGMMPLVPYLLGNPHPAGTRLVDYQKCFRLTDLEAVGDKTHHTFFEMLGNWSLGDYFKEDAVAWSYEFLTKVLEIPVEYLSVTVFEGNEVVARDEETAKLWIKAGISEKHIAYRPAEDNWWPSIEQLGPCGSDTEIFYWSDTKNPPPEVYDPEDDRWVEIWNNVFMQFNHLESGEFVELKQKNVDTGMGVERATAALAGVDDNYRTELWWPVITKICELSGKEYTEENQRPMRIIADHCRAVMMIASDDAHIVPSNTDQGYVLRRLIRRMLRYAKMLEININEDFDVEIVSILSDIFADYYPEVKRNFNQVAEVLRTEKKKFAKTIEDGMKEFEKSLKNLGDAKQLPAEKAFRLFDTFGFPIEMTVELCNERGITVDEEGFKALFAKHQEISRKGSEGKFKGGLAESNDETARLHTATHLLQGALRKVLGTGVQQKGSNITSERLRFDFSFDRKMTPEEIAEVEKLVNEAIKADVEIVKKEMSYEEAKESGALGFFSNKYGETVYVYEMGEFSKEICGGPHANRTGELGSFKIQKEQACSSGVRRIKAVIQHD